MISMNLIQNYVGIGSARETFVDVEGTKDVKRLINLLAITDQFIPRYRRGSERLRKQMLINTHKVNRCTQM